MTRTLFLLVVSTFLSACTPGLKFVESTEVNSALGGTIDEKACLLTTPNFQINTAVDAFQLSGGVNGGAGFNPGGILQAIGVNVTYSSGELNMSMVFNAPLFGPSPIANSTGKATTNNFSISTTGLAGLVTGNAGAWSSTGFYQASQDALSNTFDALKANLPAQPPWWTVVSAAVNENEFLIPVGTTAGLQVGDQFNVFKVDYQWQGDGLPCQNPLKIALKLSSQPFAVVTVKQVELGYAAVFISKSINGDVIGAFDRLEIKQLMKAPGGAARTTLNYSVRLGGVTQSNGLVFSDGKFSHAIDMTPFVRSQLNDLLANKIAGYYLVH